MFPESATVEETLDAAFITFDRRLGRLTPTWTWPAFFFPIPWYVIKGLWVKALIMVSILVVLVVGVFESGIDTILSLYLVALSAYAGLFAKYDVYAWRRFGKQLW